MKARDDNTALPDGYMAPGTSELLMSASTFHCPSTFFHTDT
jgi:hypothetical protein